MRTTLASLKSPAFALIRLGFTYAFFFYVAHFTEIQSLALAVVALCALDAYRLASKQPPKFAPFWVRIEPNWRPICHDFNLAAGDKWTELQERCKTTEEGYSILHNGVNFTMLSDTLFYSNDHKTFFGELDFNIGLEQLRPEPGNTFSFAPQFYIKRTLAGEKKKVAVIEFGLVTEESLKKSVHPRDDRANIPIAWLPEIIFFGYAHPDNWDKMKEIEAQTKQLADFGWKEKERDPEDSWLRWPYEVDHKYIRLTYRGIS
jgi:hypothetical protein